MKKQKLAAAIVAAIASLSVANLQAASIEAGDWTSSLGGNINTYFNQTSCDAADLAAGGGTLAGLACAGAVDKDGQPTNVSAISNGLLPSSLNFGAKSTQNGYDVGATINVYYGSVSNTALGFSSVDARQVFLTVGTEDKGSVKLGRDFGLFGFDAIIGDMSLLGVGAAFVSATPGHTSLGGLGYGYVYTDRLTQINYATPTRNGLQATVGIFQPLDGAGATSGSAPGFHGKVSYAWDGKISGKISGSFLNQAVVAAGRDSDIKGADLYLNANIDKFGFTGYLFEGEGMSTLALGGLVSPGFDAAGEAEDSSGGYVQGTYAFGKTKVGLSLMSSEQTRITKVENTKTSLGLYHSLTPSLTIVGEYSSQESKLTDSGLSDESSNLNIGAILFF